MRAFICVLLLAGCAAPSPPPANPAPAPIKRSVGKAPLAGLTIFVWLRDYAGEPRAYSAAFEKALLDALDEAGYRIVSDRKKPAQFQLWATVYIDGQRYALADADLYDSKATRRLANARQEDPATQDPTVFARLAEGIVNKLNKSAALIDTARSKK